MNLRCPAQGIQAGGGGGAMTTGGGGGGAKTTGEGERTIGGGPQATPTQGGEGGGAQAIRLIIKLSWKTRAVQAIKSEVENLCLSSENITNAADSFKMTGRYKNAQITFKSMLNFVSKAVKHGHGPPSESLETYHTRVKKILKDGNYSSWEHGNRLAITSKHGSVFLLRAYNTKKYQFSSCYTQKEFPYHDIEASIPGEA
ncbi:hypothetical protein QR680_011267 [Steinernema hermaphroditum]|uniref:Uncharacterized protein n=1 Tax=Steinernema hermaphroditum TaxID=289476 RepID=A0AA39ITG6_9BILA|nr:hypothetical protein QR680_011267 [Steinernema hermaphroditum]